LPSCVHLIGATGRSGQAVVRVLLDHGVTVVPVLRNAEKWRATGIGASALVSAPMLADLRDGPALFRALEGAVAVVSTAHARHTAAILAASTAHVACFVLLGSTRLFSAWPDSHGHGVREGEDAFLRSGRKGVMLHPTMIYGARGENNVQRLSMLMRHLPFLPLPKGGAMKVQPIHQADLAAAVCAALAAPWDGPHHLVIAGPEPVRYADFTRAIALAAGLRPRPILPVPVWILRALAPFSAWLPFLPRIHRDEIRRLTEDKDFDITPMRHILGINPRPLAQGLAETFGPIREGDKIPPS
jgi:uncharacterized protein YbjT (DUF2867 family)